MFKKANIESMEGLSIGPRTYSQVVGEGSRPLEGVVVISSEDEIDLSSEEDFPVLCKPGARRRRREMSSSSEVTPKRPTRTSSYTQMSLNVIKRKISFDDEDSNESQMLSENEVLDCGAPVIEETFRNTQTKKQSDVSEIKSPELCKEQDLLPIYERKAKGIETKEAVEILLEKNATDDDVARTVPTGVQENCLFIVDLETIGHWKNLLADDNGVWRQTGKKTLFVEHSDSVQISSVQSDFASHKLTRYFYVSGSSSDFHRVIIILERMTDDCISLHRTGIVQYYFDNEEHPIKVLPHGNSKSAKPFMKTMETTKQVIKQRATLETPKSVFYNVIDSFGGLDKIKSCGEKPRNLQQIKNFRREDKTDDLYDVMDMCKEDSSFIRKVTVAPEFAVVVASEQQLIDIERFCTNPEGFSILGVDATFNVGDFFVTLTTYRNLHLLSKQMVHPVMIGPTLIHYRRVYESYVHLPSTILELNPSMKNLICVGTDGEQAISSSFENILSGTKHLLCDIHMRDNIKHKLRDLAIDKALSTLIVKDIFGIQIGRTKVRGLVDINDHETIDEQVQIVTDRWAAETNSSKMQDFIKYFREKKAPCTHQMLYEC